MANECWGPPPYPLGSAALGMSGDEAMTGTPEHRITLNYAVPQPASEDARYILDKVLPEMLESFLTKNRKYVSVEEGYDLGEAGIIPDLNRKLGILVDRLWYKNPSVGEDTDEVITDLIGHLLLMQAKRRHHRHG